MTTEILHRCQLCGTIFVQSFNGRDEVAETFFVITGIYPKKANETRPPREAHHSCADGSMGVSTFVGTRLAKK